MNIFRIFIALFLVSLGHQSWSVEPPEIYEDQLPIWMVPQAFQLSEITFIDLQFEQISDSNCGQKRYNFTLTYRGDLEPFLEASALSFCGDTHSMGMQTSIPVIKDGVLNIFNYWNYWGLDGGLPVGAMKTTYDLNNSRLARSASKVYHEPGYQEGGLLLREGAQNEAETHERQELISQLENQFASDFVFGADRDTLFVEVLTELHDIIQLHSGHWCQENPPQDRTVAGADIGLTPCDSN